MPNQKNQKKWVKGCFAKKIEFQNGGSILKLSIKAEEMGQFLVAESNDAGWINLVIAEKRKPDDKGNTHNIYVDEWKPDGNRSDSRPPRSQQRSEPPPRDDFPPDTDENIPW